MTLLTYLIDFTERWLGHFPRVVLAFIGVLLCVLIVVAFWDRRIRISGGIIGILAGLGLVFHAAILDTVSGLQVDERLRIIGILIGLITIGITVQAIRTSYLHKRYALLWLGTGLGLLLISLSPGILISLENSLGFSRLTLLGGAGFFILLLMGFHTSLALTRLEEQHQLIQQRLARLETTLLPETTIASHVQGTPPTAKASFWTAGLSFASWRQQHDLSAQSVRRAIRGTRVGGPLVIALATLAVILVGLATPQAMVGDEVTHYYMLVKQSQNISQPNFYADIPMADGGIETRRYPHSFVWHYFGALVYRLSGNSFAAVQLYQALFLLQLLTVGYLLARSRGGIESRSALLYVLTLASLPLSLILSVAFYQDVPMTAQALTAFYLLQKRRWLLASLFMALAIGFKVTAVLFFPAFFLLLFYWQTRRDGLRQGLLALSCSALIVLGSTWALGKAINTYGQAAFYPQEKLNILINVVKNRLGIVYGEEQQTIAEVAEKTHSVLPTSAGQKTPETAPVIIANNPGDLRIKENYFVYGGILLWLVLLTGPLACLPIPTRGRQQLTQQNYPTIWLLTIGGSFVLMAAYLTKTAPDARFFLPGLPFILLPAVEWVVRLPKPKLLISLLATLALLQTGYVLNKAYTLRYVSPSIHEGIAYLKAHPPTPRTIFMYPEGNYRLFPLQHEWYLGYTLRDFWRANNDRRIEILRQYGVGAIVIKKHLIAQVDNEITNLGVYPVGFVDDLSHDARFENVFENKDLMIFELAD